MPSHSVNRVTVLGPAPDVAAFVDKANGPEQHYAPAVYEIEDAKRSGKPLPTRRSSVFSFHALIPIPADVEAKKYNDGGYECERAMWGVKWGAYDVERISTQPGRAEYRFTTAWSPPYTFLQRVSHTWPTLTFLVSYSEEYPTKGRAIIHAGEIDRVAEQKGGEPEFHSGDCDDKGEDGGCAACDRSQAWRDEYVTEHDAWVLSRLPS